MAGAVVALEIRSWDLWVLFARGSRGRVDVGSRDLGAASCVGLGYLSEVEPRSTIFKPNNRTWLHVHTIYITAQEKHLWTFRLLETTFFLFTIV